MRTKKEINIQIGERVRQARDSRKLTQEQLAEYIDVSPQYVSDLERGVVGVSIPTLKRICMTLCISSDQILFGQAKADRSAAIAEQCQSLSEGEFQLLSEIVVRYIQAVNLARQGQT